MTMLFAQDIFLNARPGRKRERRSPERFRTPREAGGEGQRDVQTSSDEPGGAHDKRKIFYHGLKQESKTEGFAEWGVRRLGAQHSAA